MKKSLFTSATALIAGAVIALAAPLAASAHVGIDPNQSDPGTYPLITFKVPTESATATTTTFISPQLANPWVPPSSSLVPSLPSCQQQEQKWQEQQQGRQHHL